MRFLFLILVVAPVLGTEFHGHTRERRQAQQPHYRAYNQAPAAIKQILAAQQYRDPIVHLPPQPVPNFAPSTPIQPQHVAQNQLSQYKPKVQIGQAPQQPNVQIGQAPQQPTYKEIAVQPAQYNPPAAAQKEYNPQYLGSYGAQQQQQQQQQAAQNNYQYSRNLPPHLQQLVQFQQNLGNPQGQHQG